MKVLDLLTLGQGPEGLLSLSGLGTLLQSLSRGELPELTSLIYEARERCLDLLRQDPARSGTFLATVRLLP